MGIWRWSARQIRAGPLRNCPQNWFLTVSRRSAGELPLVPSPCLPFGLVFPGPTGLWSRLWVVQLLPCLVAPLSLQAPLTGLFAASPITLEHHAGRLERLSCLVDSGTAASFQSLSFHLLHVSSPRIGMNRATELRRLAGLLDHLASRRRRTAQHGAVSWPFPRELRPSGCRGARVGHDVIAAGHHVNPPITLASGGGMAHGSAVGLACKSRPAVPHMLELERTRLARAVSACAAVHPRSSPLSAPKKARRRLFASSPSSVPAGTAPFRTTLATAGTPCPWSRFPRPMLWLPRRAPLPRSRLRCLWLVAIRPSCTLHLDFRLPLMASGDHARRQRRKRTMRSMWREV